MTGPHLLDDEIGRKLAEAQRTGELQSAKAYGKPLTEDAGWAQTPDALRMPYKILKDAGVVPAEVEMMKARARLRQKIGDAQDPVVVKSLQRQLAVLEQTIALRLETLRRQG